MECAPGEQMQADFGRGRPHLFRCVLSHSRNGYTEVVWRQTTETFIRCVENASKHFGGSQRLIRSRHQLRRDESNPSILPDLRSLYWKVPGRTLISKPSSGLIPQR